jgi:ribosome-associated protein
VTCVEAAREKKASHLRVLDLRPVTSFADFFVVCTGANTRQIQTVCDEIEKRMRERGEKMISLEGYENADWVLLDYGDLIVHVFSETARSYYDLDRLWRDAAEVPLPLE